jgi:16S rRNA (guanine527-N7)-methyltransferase
VREEFIQAIKTHQTAFELDLPEPAIERLADYYELVIEQNPLLHLVGPCSPEEFAVRHILESLALLAYLPQGAKFADVGAGAGLPSIPCLLVREDLRAVLIESKQKKVSFLRLVVAQSKLSERAKILDRQFGEVEMPDVSGVTCRALDKFAQKLPQLIRWSGNSSLFLFGGQSLRDALIKNRIMFEERLLPMSEQRFLFYRP